VDRNNREIDYAYFNNGLLQTETWKDSSGTVVNAINHTYNEDNQPLSVSDNAGEIDWTYDEVGRLATQKDVYGLILTYSWDTADRMTGVSDSLGGTETNVFDDAGRVSSIQFTSGTTQLREDWQYNADSEVTLEKRFSDTAGTNLIGQTSMGYDDGGRVTDINHKTAAGVTIDDFGYQYDQADRVTQETSTLGPTRNYGYDKAGEVISDGSNNWTYDLTGNRTNTGYQTGAANQLVTDGTYDYTFDNEGNEVKKVNISTGETWNYTFDNANRLTRAERHSSDGGPLTLLETMGYDALGDRIQTSVDDDGSGPDPAVVTDYAYDRGNAWADLTQGGSLITRRLFQDVLDSEFARIGSGGSIDWYLTDRLGSVRDLIDGTGALKDHLDYSTFGQQIYESNPGYADRYTYASREVDSAIKLEYNRARYYDASTGRWMSQDPMGFDAGDSNLYRYANNGAINSTDPTGLQVGSLGGPRPDPKGVVPPDFGTPPIAPQPPEGPIFFVPVTKKSPSSGYDLELELKKQDSWAKKSIADKTIQNAYDLGLLKPRSGPSDLSTRMGPEANRKESDWLDIFAGGAYELSGLKNIVEGTIVARAKAIEDVVSSIVAGDWKGAGKKARDYELARLGGILDSMTEMTGVAAFAKACGKDISVVNEMVAWKLIDKSRALVGAKIGKGDFDLAMAALTWAEARVLQQIRNESNLVREIDRLERALLNPPSAQEQQEISKALSVLNRELQRMRGIGAN
jgi:RHS repeat-associated protein